MSAERTRSGLVVPGAGLLVPAELRAEQLERENAELKRRVAMLEVAVKQAAILLGHEAPVALSNRATRRREARKREKATKKSVRGPAVGSRDEKGAMDG